MSTIQLAGALLVAGTLIFFLGAGLPTWRTFIEPDADKRVQLITTLHRYWVLAHILFLVGVVVKAIALGIFTTVPELANVRPLAVIGLVAFIAGSLDWAYITVAFRLAMPPEEYVRTTAGAWTFPAYALLTLGALILYGIVLLLVDFPAWLGIATIGLSSVLLVAFIIRSVSIPAFFYIPTLIMGIAFLSS